MSTEMKPIVWNAPGKPYDGKPVYANHVFFHQLRWDDLHALPKDEQRTKIYRCPDCNAPVCWARSKRTGARYLAHAWKEVWKYKGHRSSQFYYDPSRPHFKTCTGGSHD